MALNHLHTTQKIKLILAIALITMLFAQGTIAVFEQANKNAKHAQIQNDTNSIAQYFDSNAEQLTIEPQENGAYKVIINKSDQYTVSFSKGIIYAYPVSKPNQ